MQHHLVARESTQQLKCIRFISRAVTLPDRVCCYDISRDDDVQSVKCFIKGHVTAARRPESGLQSNI